MRMRVIIFAQYLVQISDVPQVELYGTIRNCWACGTGTVSAIEFSGSYFYLI